MAAFLFYLFIPSVSLDSEDEEAPQSDQQTNYSSPFLDKKYLVFILFVTLTGLVFMQYIHTVPVYFEEVMGLNEKYIGFLLGANGLAIALIEMPLIHFLDKRINSFWLMLVGAVLIGIAFLTLNLGTEYFIGWISISFLTIGEIINLPFATTLVLNRSPNKGRGKYMGLYNMSWSFCAIVAPLIGLGIAEKYGFNLLWTISFGVTIIVAIGYFILKNNWLNKPWDMTKET